MSSYSNYNTDIEVNITGNTEGIKKAAEDSVKEADKISEKFDGMGKEGSGGFEMLKGAMESATESIIEFGKQAAEKLFDVGKEAVSLAGDYEQNMNRLRFITGASTEDMDKLSAAAVKTGQDTYFSSKDAAAGMAELAQMGYKVNDIIGLMPNVANAAMINNISLNDATNTLTETLHAYGLTTDDTAHTLDMMTRASQLGRLSFEDFGKQAQSVGGLARASGQSLAEMTVQELALTNTGMTAARASDTLRFTLTSMEKPTKNARDMLDTLGLSYFDSAGKMKPMTQIFGELQEKMKGMTQEESTFTVATLFGKNGILAYNAAVGAQTNTLADGTAGHLKGIAAEEAMRAQLENSSGTVKKATDILESGFNYAWKNLLGTWDEVQIAIGQKVLPVLTQLITWVKDFLNNFINAETKTHAVGNALADLAKTIGTVLKPIAEDILVLFGQFGQFFVNTLIPALEKVITFVVTRLVPPLLEFGTKVLKVIIQTLGEMVNFFIVYTLPVLESFANYFVVNILPILGKMVDFIANSVIPKLLDFGKFIIKEVLPPLAQIGEWVMKNILPPLGKFIDFIVNQVIPNMASTGKSIFEQIGPAITAIGKWIADVMPHIIDFVVIVGTHVVDIAKSLWDNFQKYIMPALKDLGKFIMDTVIPNIKSFIDWFAINLFPVLQQFWNIIQNTVIPVLSAWIGFLIDHVVPVIWTVVQVIATFLKPIFEAAAYVVSNVLFPAFQAIGKFMIDYVIPAFGILVDFFNNSILPVMRTVADMVGRVVGAVFTGLGEILQHIGDIITAVAVPTWNILCAVLAPVVAVFQLIGYILSNTVGAAINSVMWVINNIAVPGFNFLSTVVGNVINVIKAVVRTVANFFVDAINTPINLINNLINTLKGIPLLGGALGWLGTIPTLGYINFYATGTPSHSGGPAIVGDNGSEEVSWGGQSRIYSQPTLIPNMQAGSRVTPLGNGAGSGSPIYITNTFIVGNGMTSHDQAKLKNTVQAATEAALNTTGVGVKNNNAFKASKAS